MKMKLDEVYQDAMSFGDVHEDGTNSDLDAKTSLIATIGKEKPSLLVVAGDNLDRWKASWKTLKSTVFYESLKELLSQRATQGLMSVVIPKNHDHGMPRNMFKDRVDLEHFYYESNNLIATVGNHTYKWMHGWEYDITWGGLGKIPGIYPVAFWIAEHAPSLMIPIYRRLFGGEKQSPGVVREEIETLAPQVHPDKIITIGLSAIKKEMTYEDTIEKWNWHVAMIHDRARADVKKDGIYRILQHTHYPWDFDGMICDGGGFLWDHTFVHVTDWPRLVKIGEE